MMSTQPQLYVQFAVKRLERLHVHILTLDLSCGVAWDLILCWFILCNHTFDWMYEALPKEERQKKKRRISKLINKSYNLRLCKEIANSTKHLYLEKWRQPKWWEEPNAISLLGTVSGSGWPSIIHREYDYAAEDRGEDPTQLRIAVDGRVLDPFQLIQDCLDEVKEITKHEF
jgi:hypothetical protein